ncbi:MAG: hypothetical protein JST65_05080 [Acidobacteria bacterium]|nr:hypothetical protein [Acidobacteriota bacterium]
MKLPFLLIATLGTSLFADTIIFNLGGNTSIQLGAAASAKATGGSTLSSIDRRNAADVPVSSSLFTGNLAFTTGARGAAEPTTPIGGETLNVDPASTWSITGSGTIGATTFTNIVLASGSFTPDTTLSHGSSRNTLESNLNVSYVAPALLSAMGLHYYVPSSGALILSRPGGFSTTNYSYFNSGSGLALGQLKFVAAIPESPELSLFAAAIGLSGLGLQLRRRRRA